jgi:hypothetical protein
VSETAPENQAGPGVRDLLATTRDKARRELAARLAMTAALLGRPPGNAEVVQYNLFARGLSDTQLADWHVLLDHQEGQ